MRNSVGGGGYVVIDPPIRAWRELRPLRELAPSTPTELLHQVAASINEHISEYTEHADVRMAESQSVFESTVSELSEKLAALEKELTEKNQAFEEALTANEALSDRQATMPDNLNDAQTDNARLVTENDGLRGQVAWMEKEHKVAIQSLQAENKDLAKQHAQERIRLSDEHAAALVTQRKELTEVAEQAENRLMVLLDQERQEAKAAESKLSGNLEKVTQKVQSQRDTIVSLETRVTELSRQNEKLDSDLAIRMEANSVLQAALEEHKAATTAIKQEFSAYKQQHALGSDWVRYRTLWPAFRPN